MLVTRDLGPGPCQTWDSGSIASYLLAVSKLYDNIRTRRAAIEIDKVDCLPPFFISVTVSAGSPQDDGKPWPRIRILHPFAVLDQATIETMCTIQKLPIFSCGSDSARKESGTLQ